MRRLPLCIAGAIVLMLPSIAPATDVDPPDCQSQYNDFGDAPENIPAYPTGVIGHFPSCLAPTPPGTWDILCGAPSSTPPGATGYVEHLALPGLNFWFGCYPGPQGVDNEPDAKNGLLGGPPMCFPGPPDCVENAFGVMQFMQDECFGDGSDAGLTAMPQFVACQPSHLQMSIWNCGSPLQVYVNALVDWNQDGDWNDVLPCGAACAPEWAVKNLVLVIPQGCTPLVTPNFMVGPQPGPAWLRITVSYEPVNDDFPWAGSATMPNGILHGGETEDYPTVISAAVPTHPGTWGRLKVMYRS